MQKLTKEEKQAIAALQRLADRWPKTLWIFTVGGPLTVMKNGEDGKPIMSDLGEYSESAVVAEIVGIFADCGASLS